MVCSKGLDGRGLFAVGKGFERGENIGFYEGSPRVLSHLCSKHKFSGTANVRQQIPRRGGCAEARHFQRDVIRYINNCRAADKRAGRCTGTNAEYRLIRDSAINIVAIRAKKRIAPGEEILMSYGPNYWRDVARVHARAKAQKKQEEKKEDTQKTPRTQPTRSQGTQETSETSFIVNALSETCVQDIKDIRENCRNKQWKFKKKNKLGEGAVGVVYVACKNNTTNCMYVVKIQQLQKDGWSKKGFENEVCILRQLKSTNIAPIIYDAWTCRKNGYIIMDKLGGSMEGVSQLLFPAEIRGGQSYKNAYDFRRMLYKKAQKKLKKLHQKNITFGDLHQGNVLVSTMDLKDPDIDVFFTDFAYAIDWNGRLDQKVEFARIPNPYFSEFIGPTSFEKAKRLDRALLKRAIIEKRRGETSFDGLLEHPEDDHWKV